LVAAGGIAFDYAHVASLDTELQDAADQAALAAASQLDGTSGSMPRARAAAESLLTNRTVFANDSGGSAVTVPEANIAFFATSADAEAGTNALTNDTQYGSANFVRVAVATRRAYYALTPIVGAVSSGDISASAVAGLKGAICKVPPLMICNPKPGTPFNADAWKGIGFAATGHGNGNNGNSTNSGWAPGDFGFLGVTTATSQTATNADLLRALAVGDIPLKCYFENTGEVTTGNPQNAYDAINTRFDVYNYPANSNGQTLSVACGHGETCPAALNVTKDLINSQTVSFSKDCGLNAGAGNGNGWSLPTNNPFFPRAYKPSDTATTAIQTPKGTIGAMGLPRDDCHYTSYSRPCHTVNGDPNGSDKYGDGRWARQDYFTRYHNSNRPANWSTMTRYETYLWEISSGNYPSGNAGGGLLQQSRRVCQQGPGPQSGIDRRVLSVAVVDNCTSLAGNSQPVVIGEYADVFLVQPTVDRSKQSDYNTKINGKAVGGANGDNGDSIYVEIIGKTVTGGNASEAALTIDRKIPYLVR
jgi:Flp pilus assembly protein TadG